MQLNTPVFMSTRYFKASSLKRIATLALVTIPLIIVAPIIHAEAGKSVQPLTAKGGTIWNLRNISVCWENPRKSDRQERDWVRNQVKNTWEKYSKVRFIGWRKCDRSDGGIRIRIADKRPHVKALGRKLAGKKNGMVLNFSFKKWSKSCAKSSRRKFCIRAIAAHEFGHALGFAHEQNRSDAPKWCREQRQGPDGDIYITPYDKQSIMNYCNPKYNNDGKLSKEDKKGLRLYYNDSYPIQWSFRGPLKGKSCLKIREPSDPHTWNDNYLCTSKRWAKLLKWKWSYRGKRKNMRCTRFKEKTDPHTWHDNYLCVHKNAPLKFYWSNTGLPKKNDQCLQIYEGSDPYTWRDNFLCWKKRR